MFWYFFATPFRFQGRDLCDFSRLFFPRKTMAYAIIRTAGRQFRVAEGDTLDVDLLDSNGKTATFGDVLCFRWKRHDSRQARHAGAKVTAEVLEQRKDKKVISFKYRRRKGITRHRPPDVN